MMMLEVANHGGLWWCKAVLVHGDEGAFGCHASLFEECSQHHGQGGCKRGGQDL